jgi:dCTP deaminase
MGINRKRSMILTADMITHHRQLGDIVIEPFDQRRLGTVSYHFSLSNVYAPIDGNQDSKRQQSVDYLVIPEEGIVLEPDKIYLFSTEELLGSREFAMQIFATKSVGSMGLFIDVSANLGHMGTLCRWTLEMVATNRVRVFPGQIIGQIIFWQTQGPKTHYDGKYQLMKEPLPSMGWKEW